MSSGEIASATIKVTPDLSGFQAELQAAVNKAVKNVKVPPIGGVPTGGGKGRGLDFTSSGAGVKGLTRESQVLRGSLIGLSRVTPVTVFGLSLYGTAALAAGLAIKGAIKSTADFEHQLYVFQATTGATVDEMQAISDKAKALGSDLSLPSTSAGDAAQAMTELAKAGLSVQDTLDGSTGVLQLAAAAQLDVASAAEFVATELNAFGLAGSEATHVADLLAGASIAAQGDIRDFGTSFQQVSAVAKAADVSIETTTGALTELAKAGLRGADGGTSLRTTLLRLTPTTKQAAEYQKILGIELDQTATIGEQLPDLLDQYKASLAALTPIQRQQALTQIFGQDAYRAASILIEGGSRALEANTRAADQNGAAARLAAANAKGLSGAYSGLQSNLDTLGIELGDFVKGPLTGLVTLLSEAASGAGNLADKLGGIKFPDLGKMPAFIKFLTLAANPQLAGQYVGFKALGLFSEKGQDPDVFFNTQGGRTDPRFANTRSADRSGLDARLTDAQVKAIRARFKAEQEDRKKRKALPGDTQPTNKLETAQLNAQLSGNLQAELAADKAIEGYFEKRLKLAKEGTDRYVLILNAFKSARDATRSVQDQINGEAEADAAEAKARREEAKQIADQKKADAAQAAKDLLQLQLSTLDLAIQKADLTENKLDDVTRRQDKIKAIDRRIAFLNKITKKTTEEKQQIVDLQSARTSLLEEIKRLKKGEDGSGGGFSLQDLFQESVNQLNEFGSNVSTGVTLGGGARAALAGSFLASQTNLSEADKKKLLATAATNDLLAQMLAVLENNAWRGGDSTAVGSGDKGTVNDTVWHHYPPSPSTTRAGVHG